MASASSGCHSISTMLWPVSGSVSGTGAGVRGEPGLSSARDAAGVTEMSRTAWRRVGSASARRLSGAAEHLLEDEHVAGHQQQAPRHLRERWPASRPWADSNRSSCQV